jgi:DNA-binding transcriptional MocR family regulator
LPNIDQILTEIEADIAAGEAQLARQRELVADLEVRGQGVAFAAEILAELETIQARQIFLRDRLRAERTRRAWTGQDNTPIRQRV